MQTKLLIWELGKDFQRILKKQDDMRRAYQNDKIEFYIGDVRDPRSLKEGMYGVDYIFRAAALKFRPVNFPS